MLNEKLSSSALSLDFRCFFFFFRSISEALISRQKATIVGLDLHFHFQETVKTTIKSNSMVSAKIKEEETAMKMVMKAIKTRIVVNDFSHPHFADKQFVNIHED